MDREEFRQEAILRVFANLAPGYFLGDSNYRGYTMTDLVNKTVFAADRLTKNIFDEKMKAPQD